MKKIVIVLFLGLICHLSALDAMSSLPKEEKQVIERILEVLKLNNNDTNKKIIFDQLGDFFQKGWSAHWTTNSTGNLSKIKNSSTQICDVTLYNDNRVVNCTFVYFKNEKQLFVTLKQYVASESSKILEIYNKTKVDPKYEVQYETDNYAYFQEKGYMSYDTYHIKAPVGMVIYESSSFIDIK